MKKLETYEGVIENGRVKLSGDVGIPENTRVYVLVPGSDSASIANIPSPRLANPAQQKEFEKRVIEDANANL